MILMACGWVQTCQTALRIALRAAWVVLGLCWLGQGSACPAHVDPLQAPVIPGHGSCYGVPACCATCALGCGCDHTGQLGGHALASDNDLDLDVALPCE